MSPPFFWGHNAHQDVTMMELSMSKSRPEHAGASQGLTDVMWHSMHIIEAVVHVMVVAVKVVTSPIWWPISLLKRRKRPNQTTVQPTDAYTTDLNRPLFK